MSLEAISLLANALDNRLRQGDPLSPLLFNLVVDVLTRMLIKASNANLIRGLCYNLCP
jgi:hypothetical protein